MKTDAETKPQTRMTSRDLGQRYKLDMLRGIHTASLFLDSKEEAVKMAIHLRKYGDGTRPAGDDVVTVFDRLDKVSIEAGQRFHVVIMGPNGAPVDHWFDHQETVSCLVSVVADLGGKITVVDRKEAVT